MSYQKTKIDGTLGAEIHAHLQSLGLETPVVEDRLAVDNKDKIEQIERHVTEIWSILGMDLTDDSLIDTPKRIAKMMVLEHYWGLLPENFPKNTTIQNKMNCDEMITLTEVPVMSNCEHHGVTFAGTAVISYIPKDRVIGISKMARIVEYFARRPQVQERLTAQIFHALTYLLGTEDVGIAIKAQHFCMISRGVEAPNTWTHTTKLGGAYKTNDHTRSEFLRLTN
jgi:GTP cyclohydrolase I